MPQRDSLIRKVRKAKLEDSESISRLSQDLGYQPVADQVALDRLARVIESEIHRLWVLEESHHVAGWIHVFIAPRITSSLFAEIGGIVVCPERRRSGIGGVLVRHATSWTNDRGIELRVRSNVNRDAAHRFFQAMKFNVLKSQRVFVSGGRDRI